VAVARHTAARRACRRALRQPLAHRCLADPRHRHQPVTPVAVDPPGRDHPGPVTVRRPRQPANRAAAAKARMMRWRATPDGSDRTAWRRRAAAGFTLIEALVATALMGMVLAALATITAHWLPNWNRGIGRVQRTELVSISLNRLVADLEAA